MLCSQANLVASRAANWDSGTLDMARAILSRICAEEDARTSREVRARIGGDRALLLREIEAAFGARAPLGASGELLSLVCSADKVSPLADWLISKGAEHVLVSALDYVFSAVNPLHQKLVDSLR
jgi:ATP phosphoribosyltransferase